MTTASSPPAYSEIMLEVDLGHGRIARHDIPHDVIRDYLGGRGVAARLLWDRLHEGTDPYAPSSALILSTGTLAGTTAPMSGRATITCVSPATGQYFKSNVGGHFALVCKLNGIDHLLFHGIASDPVYLWIDGPRIELRSASELWGKTVRETTRDLQSTHGGEINVTCIGPAGENGVAFASIMTSCYNAAGRGGVGAVMGHKKLKAIAVARPIGSRTCVDSGTFRNVVAQARDALYADTMARSYFDFGTAAGISIKNELGTLPSNNFRVGWIDPIDELTSEFWNESGVLSGKAGCGSCLYSCHRHVGIESGPHSGAHSGGPEYETVSALGTGPGVTSIGVLQRANELCNDLGLDTISTGAVIQWAMETVENGLLPAAFSGEIDLRFASEEAVIRLPRLIADREGIGDLLADGVRSAAKRVGGDTWKWALQARGLEQSRVETRCTLAYALAFAVNPRGPDHLHTECLAERGNTPEARDLIEQITGDRRYARADIVDKRPEIVRWHEDIYAASDALGLCAFTTTAAYGMTPERMARLFAALTGIRSDSSDIMLAGRRILTLERLLNLRLGWKEDPDAYAPWRIVNETFRDRAGTEYRLPRDTLIGMIQDYYRLHGWDPQTGIPSDTALEGLGLLALWESVA